MKGTSEPDEIGALQSALQQVLVGTDSRVAAQQLLNQLPAKSFTLLRLRLCLKLGVPVQPVLEAQLSLLRDQARTRRELDRLYSTPKVTARLILWLPIAGAAFGQLLGLGPLSFLMFNPIGLLILLLGLALNLAGWRWSQTILRGTPSEPDLSHTQEYLLLADSLRAGLSLRACLDNLHASEVELSVGLLGLLKHQRNQGFPLIPVLESQVARLSESAKDHVRDQLEALPARLLLPMGILLLPAFLLLNVFPAAATALLVS